MFSLLPCMGCIFRRIYAVKIKDSVLHFVKSRKGLQSGAATQKIYIQKQLSHCGCLSLAIC